ncbi:MAG: biopolymer transporter ExbB [Myxococcales bacterium]|nr:biopolymer transporter ExbB [Myxococcales bacterium]|tara:strand:+ start:112 stop:768 length:657 start_codon:yes stop_codon:yes gene_type:complete
MTELFEFLQRGGLIMYPIAAFSLIALMVFIERILALRTERVIPQQLCVHVRRKLNDDKPSEALALCEADNSSMAAILASGIRRHSRPRETIKEAFEEVGRLEVTYLNRFVELLGTIAAVTPLIGLLGTVVGMIDVFRTVVEEVGVSAGAVNPGSLANGIWAALLTTAAGLSVAIPAYLGYRYLLARVDRLAIEMEEVSLSLLDEMATEHVITKTIDPT